MTFDEYQSKALLTASRKGEEGELFHRVLGLVGESGEVAEKFKKIYRDKRGEVSNEDLEEIAKELGDILWYIATLSDFFDIKLEDVAASNIEKLKSRRERGKLKGSGDNR